MRCFYLKKEVRFCFRIQYFWIIISFLTICFADIDTGENIHYRLGVKYKEEKRYDDAIEEFRKVLADYPDDYNSYMRMAEIRFIQGQPNLAVYNLKKTLQYKPGLNKVHKMLANAYEKDDQLLNAVGELQLYMQSCDPAERDSLQRIINRLVMKTAELSSTKKHGDLKKINKNNIGTFITSGDSLIDEQFKQVIKLYEQAKYDDALEILKQLRIKKPDFKGIYYYAGLIRLKTGQKKTAKTNFLRAGDFQDSVYDAHFFLGKISADEQNFKEAISQLNLYISRTISEKGKKEAIDLMASYQKAASQNLLIQEKKDTAIVKPDSLEFENKIIPQEKIASSIEIQIDSILSMMTVDTLTDVGQRLLLGIREFTSGNFDQAIREFKRILAINPTGTVALNCLYNTGICYYKLHLFKEAENQFQQIIEKYGEHPAAAQCQFLKACTYFERGDAGIAENILRNFLQKNKDHIWAYLAFEKLGDAYIEMEQNKKSIDAYGQAIAKTSNPANQVRVYFKLGNVFVDIGNSSKAIESFTNAISTGEKHAVIKHVPDAYYRAADERYKQKDYKGALELYLRITRKCPSFKETPWGLFQIGTIYKNLKRYQDAVTMFKELIRKYPDDYWAKQAQWKLEDTIWENEYQAVLK